MGVNDLTHFFSTVLDKSKENQNFWPFKNGNEKDESRKSLELFSVRILKFDF